MVAKLVKKTAKELAGAFYDNEDIFRNGNAVRSERFRDSVVSQTSFIRDYWPDFVPLARKILTHMLTEPGRSQGEKDQIFDALMRDRGFPTDEELVAPSIIQLN